MQAATPMKRRRLLTTCVACFLLIHCGCVSRSDQIVAWKNNAVSRHKIAEAMRENPLAPDQNICVSLLSKTEQASVHLVQVRVAEKPHVHQTHDLTVFVVRGYGDMTMGTETRKVREGDVIHIPAGVRHYFTNRSESPSAAVVVFSPPFDGKDTVPVE